MTASRSTEPLHDDIASTTVADWLLRRLTLSAKKPSLIGNLHVQYQRGRSMGWYWRQVIGTIATTFIMEAWRYKTLTGAVIALGILLPRIYSLAVWPGVVVRLDHLWYPHLIYSRWSWMATDPWAYRLQPHLWTGWIVWCAFLAIVAWVVTRWRQSQRDLMLALFLATQVGLNVPHLQFVVTTWWSAGDSAMWRFSLLWYSAFTLIAIRLSIMLGGVWIPALIRRSPLIGPAP